MAFTPDLSARLDQTAVDKLINSTTYPLIVSEKDTPFPGCDKQLVGEPAQGYFYTNEEATQALIACVQKAGTTPFDESSSVNDQLFSFGGEIIEQYKAALNASKLDGYEGPGTAELEKIVNGGTEALVSTLGDFGAYAWCSYIRVRLLQKPSISLKSPRIDLRNFQVQVKATGELWVKFPWLTCYQYCLKWKKVIKCKRAASLTVSVTVDVDAHVDFSSANAIVYASPAFDRLRLAYPIFDKIPLEDFANAALKQKKLPVFDASKLVKTVPVLESEFRVGTVALPPDASGVMVQVEIEQI
jgi:hypothetical protein